MKVLAFDTSNTTMAVGIMENDKVLAQIQTMVNRTHSQTLMPAIQSLMEQISWQPQELDRIVVAQGPGSYTGLRIAVTTAKTLAATLNCELVGVSSLEILAANCIDQPGWIVPFFDARRKNVYAGAYQWQDQKLVNVVPDQHLAIETLIEKLRGRKVYFVGTDIEKFKDQLISGLPDAVFNQVPSWNYPSGVVLAELGQKKMPEADIDNFLPRYLKLVEAEEKWLAHHHSGEESYVEKI